MTLKKPSQQANNIRKMASVDEAEALAKKLADKPYGDEVKTEQEYDKQARTTISLPASLLQDIEDRARDNKRKGIEPKSVSAVVRDALDLYLKS